MYHLIGFLFLCFVGYLVLTFGLGIFMTIMAAIAGLIDTISNRKER